MSRLFSKLSKHRRLWAATLILAVVFIAFPEEASAEFSLFKLDSIAQNVLASIAFGVSWLLALIAGLIISIQSWWLGVILNISFNLVNSAPVKLGFPIVLGVANLFFVGGLIAIAIATILRRQEYGMKKILWKLVVMAVMVNFGLVICGTLLSLSDQVTMFFIDSINDGRDANGNVDYFKLADSVAGAFNPQAMFLSTNDVTKNPALVTEELSFWATTGDDFGNAIKPIVGVMFTLGTFVIIIITLATLALMLLWRYIRIGMALIILPIAWASWIFPAYQEHYKKWWTKFTQWAIFPPVMVFFLWLGLKVSEVMSNQAGEFKPLYADERGGVKGPLAEFLGSLFTPIISESLKAFILFGIMMSGMVAAQELGVKFADAGYKAIEGAGNGAKAWAKNRAGRATARPRAAAQRAAGNVGIAKTRLGAWGAGVAERVKIFGMPLTRSTDKKKKVLDDQGKYVRVDKPPEERLSAILKEKTEQKRDDLEDRISPGGSYKQRKGETIDQWQARLAKRDKKLAPDRKPEDEAVWAARFAREAEQLAQNDRSLSQGIGETYEAWKARIIAAHPDLNRREEVESTDKWVKRINASVDEIARKAESKTGGGEKGLLASIYGGATKGFAKGAGHKSLTEKELAKIMEDKFGVHVHPDHDNHSSAPSEGDDSHGATPGGGH